MKKILLVDDKAEVRELVKVTLDGSDYEFISAVNGLEAIEKATALKPDLILLDIMMPEMDGFEACRRIKENPKTKDIPIIILTAKGQDEDVKKGLDSGALDYFVKPFSPLDLLKKIDEIFSK